MTAITASRPPAANSPTRVKVEKYAASSELLVKITLHASELAISPTSIAVIAGRTGDPRRTNHQVTSRIRLGHTR